MALKVWGSMGGAIETVAEFRCSRMAYPACRTDVLQPEGIYVLLCMLG